MNMVEQLLKFEDCVRVLLIKDSLEQSGLGLTKCIIKTLAKRVKRVHLFLYEHSRPMFTDLVEADALCIHNMSGVLNGWLDETDRTEAAADESCYALDISKCRRDEDEAVVVDSLSNLVLSTSSTRACQMLAKLSSEVGRTSGFQPVSIVALVHGDLHDAGDISRLAYTANCVLTLSPPQTQVHYACCDVLYKRPNGKVTRTNEQISLSTDFDLLSSEKIVTAIRPAATKVTKPASDPTANLTFSLSLKENEEEARSRVILPYTSASVQSNDSSGSESQKGTIFYEMDECDEIDEDPDDDLDI